MKWTSTSWASAGGALALGAVSLGGAWGCGGEPSSPSTEAQPNAASPPGQAVGAPGAAAAPRDPAAPAPQVFPYREPPAVPAETRLARLSHIQYLHSVQDLFGITDSLDVTFAPDALDGFAFDTSNAFRVDARLGPQYRAMAEKVAERVVTDDAIFARVVPCAAEAPDCSNQFLTTFGERVFRRPLDADELASFQQLFDRGAELVQSGDGFRDGVRLSVEALLQSPQFLYQTESSVTPGPAGRIALNDWEVASRLSYFLYDSMPDAELFAAARAGQLRTPEQIEAAARRMLSQPRVLDKLGSFHEQAWQFGRFSRISPDPATYPKVPGNFVTRVRESAELFVADVLESGGGLEELLTAPYAYVDDGLAPLYGMTAVPPAGSFQRVDFDNGERQGLLMQVGYLASNAYSIRTDPIHRGLFVIRNLLCRQIPDPPPGAATTPLPETDEPIDTTRQEISVLTGQLYCPTCHGTINPPGFAFEGFDAAGQVRSMENGYPVDTAAQMVLDNQTVNFSGASELVNLLAKSEEAHRCYANRWVEFAFGRPLSAEDVPTWDAIATRSLPVADIVATLVKSPQFSSLSASASAEVAP